MKRERCKIISYSIAPIHEGIIPSKKSILLWTHFEKKKQLKLVFRVKKQGAFSASLDTPGVARANLGSKSASVSSDLYIDYFAIGK